MVFCTCASCCIDTFFGEPEPEKALAPVVEETTPATDIQPAPERATSTISLSDLALQSSDLPADYLLKERSVMVSLEVTQLMRDLGWRQGYSASFYRVNRKKEDFTSLVQSISIFPPETINRVFLVEQEELAARAESSGTLNEIPFPATGDQSFAYRQTDLTDPEHQVVYTIIFTRKNVYEKIIMTGTTLDYETLKVVAQKAADRVR
jgi:hypothetical protein